MIIEACVENFSEALIAEKKGANRIELCENLSVGGTTPSFGTIKACADTLNIPSLVMIRPHGGNFIYSQNELEIMLQDITICKDLNVAGVVFGCLNPDGKSINYSQMEQLCKASTGLEVVFHRAYDEIQEPWLEIPKLKSIGITRILSSGGNGTIFEGKDNLLQTLDYCNKYGIKLTAAGKITQDTLAQAKEAVPSDNFHGRLIVGMLS